MDEFSDIRVYFCATKLLSRGGKAHTSKEKEEGMRRKGGAEGKE